MIGGVTSNHMFTMLEGVKENARLQVERIRELEEDISHLQEVKAALTTKLNTLLEDHKDRQILINKLYAITTRELGPANGQEGSSLDNPSPAGHGASSSNGNGKLPQQLGLASDTARMEEELVRKATLNYSRRQRLKKPGCFLLRSSPDGCKFGDTCAESHDVIPYGYCRQFNDTGRCAVPDCKEKHRLYDFVPTAEEWKRDYHEAVKVTAEPDGKGRKEGARRDRSSSSESSSDRRRRERKDDRSRNGRDSRESSRRTDRKRSRDWSSSSDRSLSPDGRDRGRPRQRGAQSNGGGHRDTEDRRRHDH